MIYFAETCWRGRLLASNSFCGCLLMWHSFSCWSLSVDIIIYCCRGKLFLERFIPHPADMAKFFATKSFWWRHSGETCCWCGTVFANDYSAKPTEALIMLSSRNCCWRDTAFLESFIEQAHWRLLTASSRNYLLMYWWRYLRGHLLLASSSRKLVAVMAWVHDWSIYAKPVNVLMMSSLQKLATEVAFPRKPLLTLSWRKLVADVARHFVNDLFRGSLLTCWWHYPIKTCC